MPPRRDLALTDALAMVAPGQPLREGLDRILQADMGGLIVVGDGPEVLAICWDEEFGSYTRPFDGNELDTSLPVLPPHSCAVSIVRRGIADYENLRIPWNRAVALNTDAAGAVGGRAQPFTCW